MRQSVKRRRPLARRETEAHFAGPSGQGGLLLVACGALARELVDIQRQFPDGVVEITCLPASWHNHPEKIVPGVRRKVDAALRTRRNVAVVYGDCGTGGELDAYLEQVGVPRIPGPHCYEMFLGKPVFDDEMDKALGTFFLTDYMVRHFERIVMQGMGLRRHSQLRDLYFGNYTRVLYIAQTEDAALRVRAVQAAQELGLAFEYRLAGYGGFPGFVEEALAKTQATANPPAS